MITAIILVRGGSKGIPLKNMADVGGMSLIRRSVLLCREVVDRVIVSTDHTDIMHEASQAGAEVVVRPPHMATDYASSRSCLVHVRDTLHITGTILFAQCTAPMATTEDLTACIDGVQRNPSIYYYGYDMACVVHPYHGLVIDADGDCINCDLINGVLRQDQPTYYEIAGSAWAFNATYLDQTMYSGRINWVVRPGKRLDIDTPEDLWQARQLVKDPIVMPELVGVSRQGMRPPRMSGTCVPCATAPGGGQKL